MGLPRFSPAEKSAGTFMGFASLKPKYKSFSKPDLGSCNMGLPGFEPGSSGPKPERMVQATL